MDSTERTSKEVQNEFKFKKRLITLVRKNRVLYDPMHSGFSKIDAKERIWNVIAKHLQKDVNLCKNTWIDLREEYQSYARRLRKFYSSGNANRKRRPMLVWESNMLFLWRHISNKVNCPLPYTPDDEDECSGNEHVDEVTGAAAMEDDDIVLLEDKPVVIDLSVDDDNKDSVIAPVRYQFPVTKEARELANLIQTHPELYDTQNEQYSNYKRRGIIWNLIANQMNEKATKLMKHWLLMQTRYEWELNKTPGHVDHGQSAPDTESELEKLLEFLRPYILKNTDTVYKQSHFLKEGWHEPIENFRNIYNLIWVLRKNPQIVLLTDDLLGETKKEASFFTLWSDVARVRASTPGQCECTWLILRSFHWELTHMRLHGYQLLDKWYFECIIADLYSHVELFKPRVTVSAAIGSSPKPAVTGNLAESQGEGATAKKQPNVSQLRTYRPIASTKIASVKSLATPATSTSPKVKTITTTVSSTEYVGTKSVQMSTNGRLYLTTTTPSVAGASGLATSTSSAVNMAKVADAVLTTTQSNHVNLGPVQFPYTLSEATVLTRVSLPTTTSAASTKNQLINSNGSIAISSPNLPLKTQSTIFTKVGTIPTSTLTNTTSTSASASTSTSLRTTSQQSALPKITNAVSLLNSNEIMIELISSATGNQLVVHGPPLSERYALSMATTALFIREIMAIPLLHNKNHSNPCLVNTYWKYLANKFSMPPHICKACWNFLAENFSHFPQIAPMEELMRPFKISMKVWRDSQLLKTFNEETVKKGWLSYQHKLPLVMEEISLHNALYRNLAKHKQSRVPPLVPEEQVAVAHLSIKTKFPDIPNVIVIWTAFKNIFWRYMWELESGIYNKWPMTWWRTFAKMQFLMEHRYHNMEPFYYIVRNKIIEEIEHCNAIEMTMNAMKPKATAAATTGVFRQLVSQPGGQTTPKLPTQTTPKLPTQTTPKLPTQTTPKLPTLPSASSKSPKKRDKSSAMEHSSHSPKSTAVPASVAGTHAKLTKRKSMLKIMPEIDAYTLLNAIQRYPHTYLQCSMYDKQKAWLNVSREMNTTVFCCRFTFQRALRNYRIYLARDPASRCRINQKYYKVFNEIYRALKPQRKLNVRTPTELNQSVSDSAEPVETIFPERFVLEINMDNNKSVLVMKNWAYAIGTLGFQTQEAMEARLHAIFNKFRQQNKIEN